MIELKPALRWHKNTQAIKNVSKILKKGRFYEKQNTFCFFHYCTQFWIAACDALKSLTPNKAPGMQKNMSSFLN